MHLTGAQLGFIRKHMDLTQDKLAKAIGLTGSSRISQWEGTRDASADIGREHLGALWATMANFRGKISIDLDFLTAIYEGHGLLPVLTKIVLSLTA